MSDKEIVSATALSRAVVFRAARGGGAGAPRARTRGAREGAGLLTVSTIRVSVNHV